MGRIKSKLIKRTARQLIEKLPGSFTSDFKHNEKALKDTMPSKPIRNKVAGYIGKVIKMRDNPRVIKPKVEEEPRQNFKRRRPNSRR